MKIQSFTFNPLQENTYLVWCEKTMDCAIIDAGNYESSENQLLKSFIEEQQLTPVALLGTHAHIDHIFGNWYVKKTWNIPYFLHEEDVPMFHRSEQMAALWNLSLTPSPMPDHFLQHGEKLKIGEVELEVRFVPGHAPGHVVFVNHKDGWVVGGDTLFNGSIGRTDLPGGNHQLLISKIKEQLFTLPDSYIVHSGHGPETSIGIEKESNPFF